MHARRRLYVDVSVLSRRDAGTGIQRVVRALWFELLQVDSHKFEIVPVAGSGRHVYRKIPTNFLDKPLRRLPFNIGRNRVRVRRGDVFIGLDLSTHVMPRNWRQIDKWRRAGVRIAVLVYDLLPLRHPEWFSEVAVRRFGRWAEGLARHCDALVCISKTVAEDVGHWLTERSGARDFAGPSVSSIRLAGSIARSCPTGGLPDTHDAVLRWMRSGSTIVMVGTIEPRKGHDQALAAVELLRKQKPSSDLQLIFVGRGGWKTEMFQSLLSEKQESVSWFKWINDASDEYLEKIYAECMGVIVPSRGEGFGLPIMEAAHHQKPVLARDIPVFREIAPSGVTFFQGDTDSQLAAAISAWLARAVVDPPRLQHRSWRHTALELLRTSVDPSLRPGDIWSEAGSSGSPR